MNEKRVKEIVKRLDEELENLKIEKIIIEMNNKNYALIACDNKKVYFSSSLESKKEEVGKMLEKNPFLFLYYFPFYKEKLEKIAIYKGTINNKIHYYYHISTLYFQEFMKIMHQLLKKCLK